MKGKERIDDNMGDITRFLEIQSDPLEIVNESTDSDLDKTKLIKIKKTKESHSKVPSPSTVSSRKYYNHCMIAFVLEHRRKWCHLNFCSVIK